MRLTKWKSWNDALPAPPPPPVLDEPVWVTPNDHDSTSISPLCCTEAESPSMPSILRNQRSLTWRACTFAPSGATAISLGGGEPCRRRRHFSEPVRALRADAGDRNQTRWRRQPD